MNNIHFNFCRRGSETHIQTKVNFIPMIFSTKRLENPIVGARPKRTVP